MPNAGIGGSDLQQVAAVLRSEARPPLVDDAAIRWALLVGDLVRFARAFPAPRIMKPPRRRIGESAAAALARRRDMEGAIQDYLLAARAHVMGILARHCRIDACFVQPHDEGAAAATESDRLEAWLMLRFADSVLGERLPWSGRAWWCENPLVDALSSAGIVSAEPSRAQLHALIAAGHGRFVAAAPIVAQSLVDGPDGCGSVGGISMSMRPLSPPSPATLAPVQTVVDTPDRREQKRKGRAVGPLIAVLILLATVLIWQHLLWRSLVADLLPRLVGGG